MEEIKKELKEQELDQVTGGVGSVSGYDYVKMYLKENNSILAVYSGYDVRNIHVYRDGSQIRYTRTMASGDTMDIALFGEAPLSFLVTGHACGDDVDFEYSLDVQSVL